MRKRTTSRCISVAEGARLLGIDRGTLRGWNARAGGKAGAVDLAHILAWRLESQRAELVLRHRAEMERLERALENGDQAAGEPMTSAEALRRRRVALARLSELDVLEREGSLIAVSEAEESWVAACSAISQRLDALSSKAAPAVRATASDAEGEAVLRGFVNEARTDLANLGDELVAMDDDDEPEAA